MQFGTRFLAVAFAGLVTVTSTPASFAHTTDPLEAAPTAAAPNAKLEGTSGRIHEVIIEDHVAGMTMRHVSMVPAAGAPVALVGKQVDQVVAGQAVTVTGRRNGNVLFLDSMQAGKDVRAVSPPDTHVEGKMAVAHVDNFDTGKSEYLYEVRGDDGKVTRLAFAVAPEALQAGMRVRAHGARLDG